MNISIMLDSGAFWAWRRGRVIDLLQYIAYIKANQEHLANYVALDVIPGRMGQRAYDAEAIEAAAKASHRNLQIMKDAGLSPIPVFHQGERFNYLERLISDGETYIGISPHLRAKHNEIRLWLNEVFAILASCNVKTHGLGVTSSQLIKSYPWTTVDSSTWAIAAGLGQVPIAQQIRGIVDHRLDAEMITVSERSKFDPRRCNHIDKTGNYDEVNAYLDTIGLTLAECRYSLRHRLLAWIKHLLALQAYAEVTIVFVTNCTQAMQTDLLNCFNIEHRLLSYSDLQHQRRDALANYIQGHVGLERKRSRKRRTDWRAQWYDETWLDARRLAVYYRAIASNLAVEIRETPPQASTKSR